MKFFLFFFITIKTIDYRPDNSQDDERRIVEKNVKLDPNHTHFILVDDGTIGEYGADIEFRAKLEIGLSESASYFSQLDENHSLIFRSEKIPLILIVVEGGKNTLKTVLRSLEEAIPVLLLAVSLNR